MSRGLGYSMPVMDPESTSGSSTAANNIIDDELKKSIDDILTSDDELGS